MYRLKRNIYKNLNKSEKGQSTIELALFIPIFLLTAFLIVEIILGSYCRLVLNNVVREVARIVSVSEGENPDLTQAKVKKILDRFSANGPIRLDENEPEIFSLTWEENILDISYKTITVKATYRGIKIPLVGTLNVTASIIYPKLSRPS